MIKSPRRYGFALADSLRELWLVITLSLPFGSLPRRLPPEPTIVAGLTSYPGRIKEAWIAIECLLRQSRKPDRLFLVLSEEEFPTRQLPRRIRRQLGRGLEILWVGSNGRSFDKLIPLIKNFPESTIVTFDDDKFFPKNLLKELLEAHDLKPDHVIGARGWVVKPVEAAGSITYGEDWVRALPGDRGHHLFLPGGNGTLYPPGSLAPGVMNLKRAVELCPTADDIWFWGHIQQQRTPMLCLGLPPHRPVGKLSRGPALSEINKAENTTQLRNVIRALELEQLVEHRKNGLP